LTSTRASIIISAGAADDTQSLDQIDHAYSGDQTRLGVTEDGSMHYQAPMMFHDNVSFTNTITDGKGGTATATVGIWITD